MFVLQLKKHYWQISPSYIVRYIFKSVPLVLNADHPPTHQICSEVNIYKVVIDMDFAHIFFFFSLKISIQLLKICSTIILALKPVYSFISNSSQWCWGNFRLNTTCVVQRMDAVTNHIPRKERKRQTVPELQNNKPYQPPKQCHAEGHTEPHHNHHRGAVSRRTGWLRTPQEHSWAYL